jgi:hypothetical protein
MGRRGDISEPGVRVAAAPQGPWRGIGASGPGRGGRATLRSVAMQYRSHRSVRTRASLPAAALAPAPAPRAPPRVPRPAGERPLLPARPHSRAALGTPIRVSNWAVMGRRGERGLWQWGHMGGAMSLRESCRDCHWHRFPAGCSGSERARDAGAEVGMRGGRRGGSRGVKVKIWVADAVPA